MAIAYDTSLARQGDTGVSSVTRAMTITGSNTAIVATCYTPSTGTQTGVTYNGVALTNIHNAILGEANQKLYMDLLVGTATGSNNIVWTMSASTNPTTFAASYTGVGTGGSTGGSDSSSSASWTSVSGNRVMTTTTTVDNCWVVFGARTMDPYTAGTNCTFRQNTSGVAFIGDGNGVATPAGAYSQTFNNTPSNTGAAGTIGLAPLTASGPTNLKSLDTNVKANIKSYNTNVLANIKSINTNA